MIKNKFFDVQSLAVSIDGKTIIHDINLCVEKGSVHALMGPNGSGKSSFAYTIAGHPYYRIEQGTLTFLGKDITFFAPHERARLGIFLAFQSPLEVPGVSVGAFLREAYNAVGEKNVSVRDFSQLLLARCEQLGIDNSFCERGLNDGFSGGEKKRLEILQLLVLQPKLVILDEIDSGLDVDALKVVAQGIAIAQKENPDIGIIIITHYQRVLQYLVPDYVHVVCQGKIVASGTASLAQRVEVEGYEAFK